MMRKLFLLIALGIAAPVWADVSDSGNLTIGGQGIIQGTMTVQGTGFSVGGTTFTVAGGSVTLGGRLNATAEGIKWADGTISTTASAGGGACSGICLVGRSSGTWNSFEFVLQSSSTYELNFAITATSGTSSTYSTFKCRVNGNTTAANYTQYWFPYPNAYNINNAGGAAEIVLNSCGGGYAATGDFANGKLKFETVGQGNLILSYTGTIINSCQGQLKAATLSSRTGGGYYGGSPPWTIKCWPLSTLGWYHNVKLYRLD